MLPASGDQVYHPSLPMLSLAPAIQVHSSIQYTRKRRTSPSLRRTQHTKEVPTGSHLPLMVPSLGHVILMKSVLGAGEL